MKNLKWIRDNVFAAATFLLLILGFLGALGIDSAKTFDKCSNDVILSDLIYNQTYHDAPPFIQIYGACGIDDYYTPFYEREAIPKDSFHPYYSSVLIHAKIYRLINRILPFGGKINLKILYACNVLLISAILTYIIVWLKNITNLWSGFALTVIAAFFSPNLMSLGQNLYWIGWSLFIPFAGMVYFINSRYIESKRSSFYAFLLAFIACLIKILCYFEFITTVMIAMMIPFVFYCVKKRYTLQLIIYKSLFPAWGGVCAFLAVCTYKIYLLVEELGSTAAAIDYFIYPIVERIIGSNDSTIQAIKDAGNARISDVVNLYLNTTAFNCFGLTISFREIVIAFAIAVFGVSLLIKDKILSEDAENHVIALLASSLLSLAASLSWFIIGKPHAYIHISQCLTNWYIPFVLFATVFICYAFTLYFGQEDKAENHIKIQRRKAL